jgi:uncharacterized protein YegJ (DUF2314 family)
MNFEEVDIPQFRNEYDDLFDALLKAWKTGKAIKVNTDKHPQSVRVAMKNRLLSNEETRHLFVTVIVNDDGCTIYIEKSKC